MSNPSPVTVPPPNPDGLATALARNIQALTEREHREARSAGLEERIAETITRFTGSMRFVYLHMVVFGAWVLVNLGLIPGAPRFDPTFVILATVASVEAIFLSTFVLISQNRAAAASDRRAKLDLQISLLAEHELTRLGALTVAMAKRMGVEEASNPEFRELEKDVAPEAVLDHLDRAERPSGA